MLFMNGPQRRTQSLDCTANLELIHYNLVQIVKESITFIIRKIEFVRNLLTFYSNENLLNTKVDCIISLISFIFLLFL